VAGPGRGGRATAGPPPPRGGTRVFGVWMTWRAAMREALYGSGGFYARGERPAAHFRTSVHA